jgi:hypothetical protein
MKDQFILKKIYFDNMDYSAVYVHPNNLNGLITSHHTRPIIKLSINGKSIFRKVRAKTIEGLNKDVIGIDHISMIELNAKNENEVTYKRANYYERLIIYYRKHPNEDVRGAWLYFIVGILMSIISLVLTIIGLYK